MGVKEIKTAVGQLDIVTQRNASTSTLTANSAQSLATQSDGLKQAVQELQMSVMGSSSDIVEDTAINTDLVIA